MAQPTDTQHKPSPKISGGVNSIYLPENPRVSGGNNNIYLKDKFDKKSLEILKSLLTQSVSSSLSFFPIFFPGL